MTALLFIVILVGLVVIHEFGHFIVAKASGVKVEEFSVGFGPRLFGFTSGGTLYAFRLFLIGGYVRLYGMEPGQPETEDSFNERPLWARILTIAAGPGMNVLLAIALFWVLDSAIGLPQIVPGPPQVAQLERGMPAQRAGLKPGDRLLAANGKPLRSWNGLLSTVAASHGQPIRFLVQQGTARRTVTLRPAPDPSAQGQLHIGVLAATRNVPMPLLAGLTAGIGQTWSVCNLLVTTIVGALVHGRSPPVSGIVGIYGAVQQAEAAGLAQVLTLAAVLSANLAVINLVPFPPLDGERLLLLFVEWVRRGRRLDPGREALVNTIGLALLLVLAVVLAYHDVVHMHGTL
jgi:regulator of sigma E protease